MEITVRIDKWLWAIRIYKTRSLASEACRGGKVKINGQDIKPSKIVKIGDVYSISVDHITRTVKVIALTEKRLSPKLVDGIYEDLTPKEEYQKPILLKNFAFSRRNKGAGRPTKKERRDLDGIFE
jgi:ribosome-associated heat shock protein Hsp15